MNQILVTQKVYVTPELKKKKKFYKMHFFLSVFLVCALFVYYIYSDYDRNKSEGLSREILAKVNFEDTTKMNGEESSVIVILNEEDESSRNLPLEEETPEAEEYTTDSGDTYTVIGTVNIPEIDVNYPILSKTTNELLKISPCKFWGADPNQIGNFCIVGHNYRNQKFFSKVPTLEYGDIIEITDQKNITLQYRIYDKYTVSDTQTECTSQLTDGRKEVTLITCTNDSKNRVIVKAREM